MEVINPVEEKVDTGKYNMFSKNEDEEEAIPKTKRTITVMPVRSGNSCSQELLEARSRLRLRATNEESYAKLV